LHKDFKAPFSKIKENKASSLSGRHKGHYKTTAKMESNDIRTILAEIAETALLTANPLP